MRLVTIDQDLLERYKVDPQVLYKNKRPYVLVIRLLYKGRKQDFAVPLRSNIPASAPKGEYFALPPRPVTRPKNRHGIHYIKMFPVDSRYLRRYRTEGNEFATLIQHIIDQHSSQIIRDCQNYLSDYEHGNHPPFATDIDLLLELLHQKQN